MPDKSDPRDPALASAGPARAAELADLSLEAAELERLVKDFASELRKLDEGLKLLAAYVTRMQARAPGVRGTLH